MKKILFLIMTCFVANTAHAGLFESDYFEPGVLCVAGGVGGYMAASKGNELLVAGIGCGAGFVSGLIINSHFKSKFGRAYQQEVGELKNTVREFQMLQAQQAAKGDANSGISLRVREVIPGKTLPNGSVTAPTVRERLVLPGENLRVGD